MSEGVLTSKKLPVGQMMKCTACDVDHQLNTVTRQRNEVFVWTVQKKKKRLPIQDFADLYIERGLRSSSVE